MGQTPFDHHDLTAAHLMITPSIAGDRPLQDSFGGGLQTLSAKFDIFSGDPYLVAASIILAPINTELVFVDPPLAVLLVSHRVGLEIAVCAENVGKMYVVGHFHSGKFGTYLRTAELLEFFRGVAAHT